MDTIPVALIFDIEPDPRVPLGRGPAPCLGFEKLVGMIPALREQLSSASGAPATFTWTLRIDPQTGVLYGSPTWLAERYARELTEFRAAGDDLGLHPHSWRWEGRWISDDADAEWVAHCIAVGLDGFRQAFGDPCRVHKHGDRFMSTAVARQLDEAGIAVDFSIEPGLPATRGLAPSEETTGWVPDTTTVPSHVYRPSLDDFREPDATRRDGLVMMPLSSGLRFAQAARGVTTAVAEPLTLWTHPVRFREQLRVLLNSPTLTHLAFAVRTDTVLNADLWTFVEANQAEVGRQLRHRHRWCGGLEGARRALQHLGTLRRPVEEPPEACEARARLWARGRSDRGFREGVDLETLDLYDGHPLLVEVGEPTPRVSVILPVYAGRRHLREAIDSVIHQTQPPEELVVVNDGSLAEDLEFLNGVTSPFPIRVLHQSNAGQSAARNRGVHAATGELLAFLDQDDLWDPRHLAILCQPFVDDPEVVWSYSDFDEIDSEGRCVTRAYLREHGVLHPKNTLAACLERDLMVPRPRASSAERSSTRSADSTRRCAAMRTTTSTSGPFEPGGVSPSTTRR